jgi:hypothetical protein
MTFFITSAGPGDGANLGGLAGADAHCQMLADTAGAGGRTWRAYLSTSTENARDRIGAGPWHNQAGVLIAENIEALHGEANAISKETGLTEAGAPVNGRGDDPNRHDILTGSNPDGTAAAQKPARNGRQTAKAARWSAIMTGWACAMTPLPNRGTPRIPPAAAARRTFRVQGAMGSFIVLLQISWGRSVSDPTCRFTCLRRP